MAESENTRAAGSQETQLLGERPWRSIAKAFSWRLIGTLDTFLLSAVIIKYFGPFLGMDEHTSNTEIAAIAGYIAITEVVTKIILYSLHERFWVHMTWNVSNKAGRRTEGYSRTAMKTATWRVLASLDTMLIAWFFTGNLKVAFSVGSLEVITKLVLYFLHERIWVRIPYGIYVSRRLNERYKKREDKKEIKKQKKTAKKKAKSKTK